MRERPEVFRKYDIRGKVPEEIDENLVFHIGQALGRYWSSGDIVVGRDIRESSPKFYNSIIEGLRTQRCKVTQIGLATTDMTALLAKQDFDAGIQITASHMPPEYGGIKPLNHQGRILSNEEMAEVKKIYLNEEQFQDKEKGAVEDIEAEEKYVDALEKRYGEIFDGGLDEMKIVVDSSNSVGDIGLPVALNELGAEVVKINSEHNPDFPAHSPEPGRESSQDLQEKVMEENADYGIILDGDADRAMFVDENGDFLDGNTTLAIFAGKYLEFTDKVVCSVNISKMVEDTVSERGGEIIYAPVGAVFTALECLENDIVFGGQPNGHLMDSEFVPYDSGSFFGLLMAGVLDESGKKLSELREEVDSYERKQFNFETDRKNKKMLDLREKAVSQDNLESEEFNCLKIGFEGFEVFMRPSGSEKKIRVRLEGEKIPEKATEEVRDFMESV